MDTAELDGIGPFDLYDAEVARLDRYFSALAAEEWDRPSRCRGWSVRDVLAHLAGEEMYNHAALDDDVDGLFARLSAAGVGGLAGFNQWSVDQRRGLPVEQVLEEWRTANDRTRRRMRALGRDAPLPTAAGPYPVGQQTLHYSSEVATHADDVWVPVSEDEEPGRTDWRARLGRAVLAEQGSAVQVAAESDGTVTVHLGEKQARLSARDFVEACVDRLPRDHPLVRELREALVCLA